MTRNKSNKRLSLHGLQFEEAVAALLKVKTEKKKTPKKKRTKKS